MNRKTSLFFTFSSMKALISVIAAAFREPRAGQKMVRPQIGAWRGPVAGAIGTRRSSRGASQKRHDAGWLEPRGNPGVGGDMLNGGAQNGVPAGAAGAV